MSSEYIFEINDALYDHETGKVCMMPKIVGALIRCKDCKHLILTGGNESTGEGIYTCDVWKRRKFNGTGFCSYAERRSDEQ